MSNMNSAAHGTPVEDEGPTGENFLSWSILDELNLSFLMEAMPEMIGSPIKVRLDASPRADILVTREATSRSKAAVSRAPCDSCASRRPRRGTSADGGCCGG